MKKFPFALAVVWMVLALPTLGAAISTPDEVASAGKKFVELLSKENFAGAVAQFDLVKSPEGLKSAIKWAVASNKSVVARVMYEAMTTDVRPKLHEIKTAVTMLYPWDSSTGMPQAAVDGLYQENFAPVPHKKLVRIDNSFHFIMLDQPDSFAAQADAFLNDTKGGKP